MCDDSCSRGGTRRCYRHSSSAERWEARSRLRPPAFASARGGSRISRRHVSRSRMSVMSGDSAGDGNRGVHQALCGGIVVSGRALEPRLGAALRSMCTFSVFPPACALFVFGVETRRKSKCNLNFELRDTRSRETIFLQSNMQANFLLDQAGRFCIFFCVYVYSTQLLALPLVLLWLIAGAAGR